MSTELPLQIRLDIRDQWESQEGLVQKSVNSLEKTLGYKITPLVQWPEFYRALRETYPDNGVLVPTVVRLVAFVYDLLLARLERDGEGKWTEQLLDEMQKRAGWVLHIEVYNGSRPRISFRGSMGELLLEFPSRSMSSNASVQTALERDMDQFFSLATPASVELEHEDGWDELVPVKNDEASPIRHQGSPSVQATSQVPALESLPKPTDLFKVTLPYILRVDARTSPLVVECSHQQSLDLLVAYFGRWAKTNMRDSLKRPTLKVTQKRSDFFLGIIDRVEIEQQFGNISSEPLNPVVILAFVEGILGYKETHTTGSIWTFKRLQLLTE